MTRQDDIITLAHVAGVVDFLYSNPDLQDAFEFLQRFAALVATAERRKHQADIEKWKTEAATAEKWRGLALSKDGDGRCVQRIQQEAAEKAHQPLTEEHIYRLYSNAMRGYWVESFHHWRLKKRNEAYEFARAIEAAHGIT